MKLCISFWMFISMWGNAQDNNNVLYPEGIPCNSSEKLYRTSENTKNKPAK